jgi:hypothetical protein
VREGRKAREKQGWFMGGGPFSCTHRKHRDDIAARREEEAAPPSTTRGVSYGSKLYPPRIPRLGDRAGQGVRSELYLPRATMF